MDELTIYVGSAERTVREFERIGASVLERDGVGATLVIDGANGQKLKLDVREAFTDSIRTPDQARTRFLADREPGE